ncbi:MAG: hypothetical protein HYT98_02255 [Candidatus Sungbacteria bacterium]|nr:hypothetical protein [Candidatus Sungbacteria bacterium]
MSREGLQPIVPESNPAVKKLSPHEISAQKVRKEFNENVQDVLPLVKRAHSLKELWQAVDTIEKWRSDVDLAKDQGQDIPDPREDEQVMKEYLLRYTSGPHRDISPIFKEGRNILKDEVAKKIKELGLSEK